MDFKINGETKKLNFGVRFVAEIDETEKYSAEGVEFGIGLMLVQEQIASGMGVLPGYVKIIKFALSKENVTEDEVIDALDAYADEDELESLFKKVDEELKNSSAVRLTKARMDKTANEANRVKAAEKPTKK